MWHRAIEIYAQWRETRSYKTLVNILRWVVPLALAGYLAYGLTRIGWLAVWEARPTAPLFYCVLFLPFFVQPCADLIIYRRLLERGAELPLTVFLRKRYLNNAMLDYSGEAYFFFLAQQKLNLERRPLLHAVKDSNILSAGAGLVVIWVVLLALTASGGLTLPAGLSGNLWKIGSIGLLPLVLCAALILGGRRVTSLSKGQIALTFLIHLTRSIIALFLEFLLWWLSGALPTVAMCLEFVGLRLLVTRLPLVPRKDLLFVGVGMAAAGMFHVPTPRLTAALVIITGFDQVLEFVLVGLPWLFRPVDFGSSVKQTAP